MSGMPIVRPPDTPPPLSGYLLSSTVRPPQRVEHLSGLAVKHTCSTQSSTQLAMAYTEWHIECEASSSTLFLAPLALPSLGPAPAPTQGCPRTALRHAEAQKNARQGGEVCLSSLFVYYEIPMFGWVADRKIASRALSHPAIDILALFVVLYDNICIYKLPIQYHTADRASPGTRWRARLASSMICP